MIRKALLLALAVVLSIPAAAVADGGSFEDRDEQPFCEDPDPCPDTDYMDFRRLTFGHGDEAGVLRHGLETRKRWKTRELGGPHGVTFYVDFDTDGDRDVERRLRIRRKDGELWAGMFRGRRLRKSVPGHIRVWRPGPRGAKVRFAAGLLGDGVEEYRWRVHWANRNLACPGSCSTDFAPGKGWYEHRL